MKALIAGGGIGGLTAALALLDSGFEIDLHERTPEISEVGAGIQISPNGVKVLRRLGVEAALDHVAFRPEALEMRHGASGAQIFSIPMRGIAESRYGAPYYHVHRADLLELLYQKLKSRAPDAIHVNSQLQSFAQEVSQVSVQFSNGDSANADLLIGADGIHSTVRTQLLGECQARFTGNAAWRVVLPADAALKELIPPTACIWVGPGRHAVTYYLRRGELINFVGIVERSDWQKESWTEPGSQSELAADFAAYAKPIKAIIERAGECFRWALFDRDPLASWSEGRVTLLGDACHPMLPFLAQGAVMGIEDAWVLSQSLKRHADIPAALREYQAQRLPRTSRVQLRARGQMGLYHRRTLMSQLMTYGPMWMASQLAPAKVHAMQDWLYAHDVTV